MTLWPCPTAGETEAQARQGAAKGTGDALAKLLPGWGACWWGDTLGFCAPLPGPSSSVSCRSLECLPLCRVVGLTECQSQGKRGAGGPPSWSEGCCPQRGEGLASVSGPGGSASLLPLAGPGGESATPLHLPGLRGSGLWCQRCPGARSAWQARKPFRELAAGRPPAQRCQPVLSRGPAKKAERESLLVPAVARGRGG